MPKYLSGKVKVNPQDKLSSYRNTYLELGDAEPNLSNPSTLGIVNGGSSSGIPAGTRYQSITIHGDTTGNRYWIPVGGGVIPGSISVYEEGVIVGTANSITQLNFVGNIIAAVADEAVGTNPGNIATISVRPNTGDKEILFSKDPTGTGATDFSGSSDFTFNYNVGIVSVVTGVHIDPLGLGATFNVGAGGSVFSVVSAGNTALIGIGTTNPVQNLDVKGNIKLDGDLYLHNAGSIVDYTGNFGAEANILTKGTNGVEWLRPNQIVAGAAATVTVLQYHKAGGILGGASNYNSGTGAMSIAVVWDPTNNRLGIGSTQPSSLLDVEGNSIFTGITSFVGLTTVTEGGLGANTLTVSGLSTFNDVIDANNGINASTAKIENLTADRVVFTSTGGELQTSNNISYNTTDGLNVTGLITATNLAASGVGTIANIEIGGSNNNEIKTLSAGLILSSASALVRIDDKVEVNDNTDSTNSLDGALISDGGLGVAKNANIGKNVNVGGALSVTGTSVGVAVTLAAAGGITTVGGDLYVGGDLFVLDDIFLDEGRFNTLIVEQNSTFEGNIDAQGDVDLGNETSDTITATGRFDSNLVPSGDTQDLGTSSQEWRNLYIDGTAEIDALEADTAKIGDLTDGRVVLAGATGELEDSANLTFDGSTLAITGSIDLSADIDVDGTANLDILDVDGASNFGADVVFAGAGSTNITFDQSAANLKFDDYAKAKFGSATNGDLEIFFDGTHSKIDHLPTGGSLFLAGDSLVLSNSGMSQYYLQASENSSILLNYSGSTKLQTSGVGVTVYAQLDVTDIDAVGVITARDHIKFANSGDGIIFGTEGSSDRPSIIGNYTSQTDNHIVFNTTGTEKLRITKDGDVGIGTDNPTGANALTNNNATLAVGSLKANNLEGTYTVPGETGQVFFNNSDVLTAASTLYWDESNDRLGISTNDPQTLLHLKSDDPTLRIQRFNQSAYGDITADTAGKITFKSDPGASASGDGFSFTVNNQEKVIINSDGKVGIGTDDPGLYKLHVQSPIATIARFERTTDSGGGSWAKVDIKSGTSSGNSYLTFSDVDATEIGAINYEHNNDSLIFHVNGDDKVAIGSTGNLNIGVNASSNPFTYLRFGASLYGAADIRPTDEASHKVGIAFYTDGTQDTLNPIERLRINSSGHLEPKLTDTYDIGTSASKRFRTIYAQTFNGAFQGTADDVKTINEDNLSSGYLTFVDSNNTTATGEVIYTSTNFEIDSSTGILKLPKTDGGIKFGPGTAGDDDAHIEWKGDSNDAGYLRISTSDNVGTEYIQFGDYSSPNKTGTFTEWLKIRRIGANLTGQLYVSGISTVNNNLDVNGVARFNDTTDATNSTTGGSVTIDGGAAIAKKLFIGSDLDVGANLDVTGTLVVDGNVTLGDIASDTVTFNADIASNLYPSAHETYNIGESASNRWNNVYAKEYYGTFKGDIANTVATLSLDASVTDVFDISSNSLSADDAGADKLVIWDDTNGKLTHAGLGTGLYYSGTNLDSTTYDFELVDYGSKTGSGTGNDAILRLNPSTGTDDDIRLIAGSNITLSQGTGTLTVSSTDTTANNLYKLECAQTGDPATDTTTTLNNNPKLSLQSNGGSGSTYSEVDSIQINGGTYCTVTRGGDGSLTINAADQTGTTYQLKATKDSDGGSTGTTANPYLFLDASSGDDDSVRLVGSGTVSVDWDDDGQITINGTDTNVNTVTNAFKTFTVNPTASAPTSLVADSTTDTLNFAAAGGMTISSNDSTNTITFSSTNTNTEYNYTAVDDSGAVKLRLATTDGVSNQDIEIAGTTDEINVTRDTSGKITLSMASGYSSGKDLSSSSKRFDVLAWTDSLANGGHTYVGNELYFFNSNKASADATISFSGGTNFVFDHNILPSATGTIDLGSTTARWNNIYVNDLQLSNKSKKDTGGNDVDGTWGDWTLQEGEDNVYMINNRTGKKYAMMLKEVEH